MRRRLLLVAAASLALCWTSAADHCADLENYAENMTVKNDYFVPQTQRVTMLCGAESACAAAALLRAAMLAAGFRANRVALIRHAPAATLCELFDSPLPPDVSQSEVVVVPASAWAGESEGCALSSGPLHAARAGAAAMGARLHARPPAGAPAACRRRLCTYYEDAPLLAECGFQSGANESAIVYVLDDEWQRWNSTELKRRLESAGASASPAGTGAAPAAAPTRISRAELMHLLADHDRALLFVDAPLWNDSNDVQTCDPLDIMVSVLAVSQQARLVTPALYDTLPKFQPCTGDLRAVLERAASPRGAGGGVAEAACELVRDATGFEDWRQQLRSPYLHKAMVIVCKKETANWRLEDIAKITEQYIFNEITKAVKLKIAVKIEEIDCLHHLEDMVHEFFKQYYGGPMYRTVGIVAPGEAAAALARYQGQLRLPLIAYDVPAAAARVRSAAGRRAHLALALRRLLAACGWWRVAMLSERTPLAVELAAEMRAPAADLLLREWNVTTEKDIHSALEDFLKDDARVFLVNAGATAAARVLAAAVWLNLTRANGYVWILRDYEDADDATAALTPYSVSFQWRGEAGAPAPAGGLRARLERKAGGGAWPRHASAIADALLTLAQGFIRLVDAKAHPEMRHQSNDDTVRYFWESVQTEVISGVVEARAYDERGVAKPLVFVHRWEARGAPRRLASWRAGEWRARDDSTCCEPTPVPRDGSVSCLLAHSADAFLPTCRDAEWAAAAASVTLAATAAALTALAARRAFRRRDLRVRIAERQLMLERRSRGFAALAQHCVDRAALELRDELGAGHFGRVRLGVLRRPGRERPALVAAKALRDDAGPAEETLFLREACTLAGLDHEHIVRFAGVCLVGGPPLLLMEHAFFGDLLSYLRARRHLAEGAVASEEAACAAGPEEAAYVSAEALTRLAHEAAAALAHVAARGFVHRDVRAANCLVDARRSLKLADFGLARATGTTDGEYACRGRALLPVLRMAPESLALGVFSAASDVWAFGVLALELVTLGARPYGAEPPPSVVRLVLEGGRPPLPRDASAETRALARACWRRVPEARPAAARLAAWLAARRRALRPALAPELDEVDADSGFGELEPPAPAP